MADFYATTLRFSVLLGGVNPVVALRVQNQCGSPLLNPAAAKPKDGWILVNSVCNAEEVLAACKAAKAD